MNGIVLRHRRRILGRTRILSNDLMKRTAMKSPDMLLAAYLKARMSPVARRRNLCDAQTPRVMAKLFSHAENMAVVSRRMVQMNLG